MKHINLFKCRANLERKTRALQMSEVKSGQVSSLESQCYTRATPEHLLTPGHWSLKVYWQQRRQGLGYMYDWIPYPTLLPYIEVGSIEGIELEKKSAHHQRKIR